MKFRLVEDKSRRLNNLVGFQDLSWVDEKNALNRLDDAKMCYDEIYHTIYNIKNIFDKYSLPFDAFLGEHEWDKYSRSMALQLMNIANEIGFED